MGATEGELEDIADWPLAESHHGKFVKDKLILERSS